MPKAEDPGTLWVGRGRHGFWLSSGGLSDFTGKEVEGLQTDARTSK